MRSTQFVVDYLMDRVDSKRVYDRIDQYREVLALFPDIGHEYDPTYAAARPPFPCRFVAIPDTPFTLYYTKDEMKCEVVVFYIEHQHANPRG